MMATVLALAEESPKFGEWIHLGATSNDILDTATGLQIKASLDILEEKLEKLLALLLDLAMQEQESGLRRPDPRPDSCAHHLRIEVRHLGLRDRPPYPEAAGSCGPGRPWAR